MGCYIYGINRDLECYYRPVINKCIKETRLIDIFGQDYFRKEK